MKKTLAVIIVVSSLALGFASNEAHAQSFVAIATGDQEVPPVDTDAFSIALFRFSGDNLLVSFRLNFLLDEPIEQAHIHLGPAGQDGPIVLDYFNALHVELGFFSYYVNFSRDLEGLLAGMTMADLLAEVEAGNAYLNLHTAQFPGGKIRGQILPIPAQSGD